MSDVKTICLGFESDGYITDRFIESQNIDSAKCA